MPYDVWFSRYDDDLFVVVTPAGHPPSKRPRRSKGVAATLRRIKEKGYKINQVGIIDPETMGLE